MPNHLHIIVGIEDKNDISEIWRDFKKFTSKKIVEELHNDAQESRREWMLNRFEYAGANDKKIKSHKFWQVGNVQEIFLFDYFIQKLNYIHENPVKAEFVDKPENYRYSSAIDYAGGDGLLQVEIVV